MFYSCLLFFLGDIKGRAPPSETETGDRLTGHQSDLQLVTGRPPTGDRPPFRPPKGGRPLFGARHMLLVASEAGQTPSK